MIKYVKLNIGVPDIVVGDIVQYQGGVSDRHWYKYRVTYVWCRVYCDLEAVNKNIFTHYTEPASVQRYEIRKQINNINN